MTETKLTLSLFDDIHEALEYALANALTDTHNDLERMSGREAEHYTDADRARVQQRLTDLQRVCGLVESGTHRLCATPRRDWNPESHWDHHPDHPVEDWQAEVANDDTRQGYRDWVESQLDA